MYDRYSYGSDYKERGISYGIKRQSKIWLNNLKLFALNSEVHCSREEKPIKQELIGTRNVNLAFNEMIEFYKIYKSDVDHKNLLWHYIRRGGFLTYTYIKL